MLIETAWNGRKELVELLLKSGADLKATDKSGKTALHWAAKSYNAEVVQLLLESGADIMAEDDTGQTPLHIAALDGDSEIVQLLLQSGADIEAMDNNGQTALQVAAGLTWTDSAVMLLLQERVDFEVEDT
jgi:ankyrin repeat protein